MDMRTDPRMQRTAEPSLGALIRSLLQDLGQLVRSEIRMAQAEVGRSLSRTRRPLSLMACGAALIFGALMSLIGAFVAWLAPLIGVGWAAFAVAIVVGGGGVAMILSGRKQMPSLNIVPSRTIESLKQDAQALRGSGE